MSIVRLKCPACDSVVRIAEATAAEHPLVRCGKCQGFVNVVTARLSGTSTSISLSALEVDHDAKRRGKVRKTPQTSGANPRILLAVAGGLVILALLCFGGYLLFSGTETPYERKVRGAVEGVERLADALEGVKTPADVTVAVDQFKTFIEELQGLALQPQDAKPPTVAEMQEINKKYEFKLAAAQGRVMLAMAKLQTKPELMFAFAREMGRVGHILAGVPGGINLDMDKGLLGQNAPPFKPNPAPNKPQDKPEPPPAVTSADVDWELKTKTSLLKELLDRIKSINDADSAEAAALILDNTLAALAQVERKLKTAERQGQQPSPAVAAQVTKEHFEILQDLLKEIVRVATLPGVGRHLAKLDQRMKELGLIQQTTFKQESNPVAVQQGDAKNPFEETGRNEDKNPFESVKTGRGEKQRMNAGEGNALVEAAVEKALSTDGFKRRDGVRELLAMRADDQHRAPVLDALLAVMEDDNANIKNDAFKAYRKWASTREDRERLGKVMEHLLSDVFVRKEVVKYVSDYKIVAAAPELARLLKDSNYRLEAGRALIAIGPEAEKSVLPHVTDLVPQVRLIAIEILAQIGTKECLPELAKMHNDRSVGVGRAAREATRLVQGRTKDK